MLGIWSCGQKDGLGKAFFMDGEIRYEGYFKNNGYDGFGVLYGSYGNQSGLKEYEGYWKNGGKSGFGKQYWALTGHNISSKNKLLKYIGNFKSNCWNRRGFEYHINGKMKAILFGYSETTELLKENETTNTNLQNKLTKSFLIAYDKDGTIMDIYSNP